MCERGYWLYCMFLTLRLDQFQWLCLPRELPPYHITDNQQTGKTQEREICIQTNKKQVQHETGLTLNGQHFNDNIEFVFTQDPTACRYVPEAAAFLWMYEGFSLFLHLLWKWQCCVNISVRKCARAATNYPYVMSSLAVFSAIKVNALNLLTKFDPLCSVLQLLHQCLHSLIIFLQCERFLVGKLPYTKLII